MSCQIDHREPWLFMTGLSGCSCFATRVPEFAEIPMLTDARPSISTIVLIFLRLQSNDSEQRRRSLNMSAPSSDPPGQDPPNPGPNGGNDKPEDNSETSSIAEENPAAPEAQATNGDSPAEGEQGGEDVQMEEAKPIEPVEDDLADVPDSVRNVCVQAYSPDSLKVLTDVFRAKFRIFRCRLG